jgi:BlaI family penicillinase repressor
MAPANTSALGNGGRRRSLLELAPLELACMNILWPIGEGTVRQIRDQLAALRPRAYTTIMTIMNRLARKGVVERRKAGRAYLYRPNLTANQARAHALGQVVENFFGGSTEAALAQLGAARDTSPQTSAVSQPEPAATVVAPPAQKTKAAAASAGSGEARIDATLL